MPRPGHGRRCRKPAKPGRANNRYRWPRCASASCRLAMMRHRGDSPVRQHHGAAFAFQNLGLDASQQDFSDLLRIVDRTRPLQKIPGDLQRVLDEGRERLGHAKATPRGPPRSCPHRADRRRPERPCVPAAMRWSVSSEVDTGSRGDNASRQDSRQGSRASVLSLDQNRKCSSATALRPRPVRPRRGRASVCSLRTAATRLRRAAAQRRSAHAVPRG